MVGGNERQRMDATSQTAVFGTSVLSATMEAKPRNEIGLSAKDAKRMIKKVEFHPCASEMERPLVGCTRSAKVRVIFGLSRTFAGFVGHPTERIGRGFSCTPFQRDRREVVVQTGMTTGRFRQWLNRNSFVLSNAQMMSS